MNWFENWVNNIWINITLYEQNQRSLHWYRTCCMQCRIEIRTFSQDQDLGMGEKWSDCSTKDICTYRIRLWDLPVQQYFGPKSLACVQDVMDIMDCDVRTSMVSRTSGTMDITDHTRKSSFRSAFGIRIPDPDAL